MMPRQALLDSVRRDQAGTSTATCIEAPLLGWNTRDPIANMLPGYARQLDNWYPQQGECVLRGGSAAWMSNPIFGGAVSLHAYGSTKLFAAGALAIYDVTAGGPLGASVAAIIGGDGISVNFTNSAGNTFLWFANGSEIWTYDGTTWVQKTGADITGISSVANIVAPWVFKRKIFFIEKNTMNAWYLPTDSIQGQASKLPLGSIFRRGGTLVAGATWTNDGGDGPDDYCVFISSEGELAVFGGIDPSSSTSWELVGVYRSGRPPSRRCFAKIGGDLGVLTQLGAMPLSKLTASDVLRPDAALTDAIRPTIEEDLRYISITNAAPGYSIMLYPAQNALIVAIPQSTFSPTGYAQYVLNVVTGAWCRFTSWNAISFCEFNGELYFGDATGYVYKAWSSAVADFSPTGAARPIVATCMQAYNYLGMRRVKKVLPLLQPMLAYNGTVTVGMAVGADFSDQPVPTGYLTPTSAAISLWDVAVWDISLWSSDFARNSNWLEVPHSPGYALSLLLQASTSNGNLSWAGTNAIVARGNLFG